MLRKALLGPTMKWSLLGQSFGGFIITSYISTAPEAIEVALIAGGLPPLGFFVDDVYARTMNRVVERNKKFYQTFAHHTDTVQRILRILSSRRVPLPSGGLLTPRRFLQLGLSFGMAAGFECIHYLLETAFRPSKAELVKLIREGGEEGGEGQEAEQTETKGRGGEQRWGVEESDEDVRRKDVVGVDEPSVDKALDARRYDGSSDDLIGNGVSGRRLDGGGGVGVIVRTGNLKPEAFTEEDCILAADCNATTTSENTTFSCSSSSSSSCCSSAADRSHATICPPMPPSTDPSSCVPLSELSYQFLRAVENLQNFEVNPLYVLLHESIYCNGPGKCTNWSAHRTLQANTDVYHQHPLFTGEMVFPWMFDDYERLRPMKEVAEMIAQKTDWTKLYDIQQLQRNTVPCAAVAYYDDMYVDLKASEEAAEQIANLRLWVTNEYQHSGLRDDGYSILGKLLWMVRGAVTIPS
eukprot:GHVS01068727.1.p1 GENE.GHVS01068727.1~~GHVS01068727.1.p1  ORF type:complete len:467 (+),score=85.41 GHVS01068727.1:505-1905(+)